ncbi:cardiolipin synthase [Desertibacillus haloalkaliphilus]|uniref:cardiolipin synthase n=1 Tax=Desertibacillus haloalkaliphilus TaxID=1328930 RepID=UPI001C262759|nr:cardiolipin synthase [Desertibacillus haloalkaliphilus]MBU8905845.1 cardiolipin synthase [Desertibacillus haloalkaliphilus]
MVATTVIILLIIALVIWLRIDFKLGMKQQQNEANKTTQQTRYGDVTFLPNGNDFFEAMFTDIEEAKHHIHILFYIVQDDQLANDLFTLLKAKVNQGVEVRLLVDWFGSGVKRRTVRQLKQAGITFAYSHPPKFPFLFFTLNRRNHRKITVIDGKVGYTGGFNVGDEYVGRSKKYGHWRDFHLRLAGDGVQDLQEQFLQDWKVATGEEPRGETIYPELKKGPIPLRILPTDGVFLEDTFLDLVKQAKRTILIGTPYFIPGEKLQGELIAACKRGVEVKLILPKMSDHPLVKEGSYPYFSDMLAAGCLIYHFHDGFYHAKAVVIDEQVCDIGTANWDKRSLFIDHELNCIIYDKSFIDTVIEAMEYDITKSEELTVKKYEQRSLVHRGKERLATAFSGLL